MKLMDLYAKFRGDLTQIEQELERSVTGDHRLLTETSLHLLKAGGKRIRPVFVLLAGKFGHYQLDVLKNVAVPLELIHMASLVHDDVIDDAETRRGQLTVKSRWDNRIAMYTGDYIHGKALTIATRIENQEFHRILARAMVQMCIGEMEQVRDFFNTNQSIRHYLRRIRRKTALLIAVSCQLGAIAAGVERQTAALLYRYGYNVGMAFQIIDDLLDLYGTEKQLGKPPGSDMKQGNLTLPVLLALQDTSRSEELLYHIERLKTGGESDAKQAIQLIKASEGTQLAEKLANRYIEKSLAVLALMPENPAKKNLTDIARFIGKRNY